MPPADDGDGGCTSNPTLRRGGQGVIFDVVRSAREEADARDGADGAFTGRRRNLGADCRREGAGGDVGTGKVGAVQWQSKVMRSAIARTRRQRSRGASEAHGLSKVSRTFGLGNVGLQLASVLGRSHCSCLGYCFDQHASTSRLVLA